MVALYKDHHVPSAITAGLRKRGVDVVTAEEDGSATLDDDHLLDRATSLGRVLFSQDQDLLAIAHRRLQTDTALVGVVYAHQLGISIGQAVRDLELIARILDPDDMQNRVEYLPYP
jgi:predicted nuclease of predicted toxin-antitoxin system